MGRNAKTTSFDETNPNTTIKYWFYEHRLLMLTWCLKLYSLTSWISVEETKV